MPHQFKHFIVTRFNLKQNIWLTDKLGSKVNDEKWLESRYQLFSKYCFPSLVSQECTNFVWLVFFDDDTPLKFKEMNEEFRMRMNNFIPVYVPGFKEFEKELPIQIKKHSDGNTNYIMTTRLDNDDALHKDAVCVLQEHFEPVDHAIIDLKNGLALQIGHTNKLSLRNGITSGPFVSLIEQLKDEKEMMTVYDREHTNWLGDAHFINVDKGHYWLQVIHKRNISNDLGNELTFNSSYLKGFEIDDTIKFSFRYYIFIILKRLKLLGLIKKVKQ
ncbi:MAG: putative rhamnosyl transferase [Bacteroidia bacterium]|nr:putative rhamnosyl transferase [Bacteroidia bacterium]NND51915.1 hypothetical protein [Flavobacteriaceae bacterium]